MAPILKKYYFYDKKLKMPQAPEDCYCCDMKQIVVNVVKIL